MKQKEDHKVCDIYYFGFVCHQKTVTFSTDKDKGCCCRERGRDMWEKEKSLHDKMCLG